VQAAHEKSKIRKDMPIADRTNARFLPIVSDEASISFFESPKEAQ
jgi:hypothetical protein